MRLCLFVFLITMSSLHAQKNDSLEIKPWRLHLKIGTQNITELNLSLEHMYSPHNGVELEASYRYPVHSMYDIDPKALVHFRRGGAIRIFCNNYFNKKQQEVFFSLNPGIYLGYYYLNDNIYDPRSQNDTLEPFATLARRDQVFTWGPMLDFGIHSTRYSKLSFYLTAGVRINQVWRVDSENNGPVDRSFFQAPAPIARLGMRLQLF